MAYVRGNKEDFNEWAALGNTGWSYDDVLPYFKKSERNENFHSEYHGTDGLLNVTHSYQPSEFALAFVEACNEAGIKKMRIIMVRNKRVHICYNSLLKIISGIVLLLLFKTCLTQIKPYR